MNSSPNTGPASILAEAEAEPIVTAETEALTGMGGAMEDAEAVAVVDEGFWSREQPWNAAIAPVTPKVTAIAERKERDGKETMAR